MTTGTSSSSRMGTSPQPPRPFLNRVFDGPAGRILCVADIRGQHSQLNQLAKDTNARAIIHTGDFGFFEAASLDPDRINDRTLKHLLLYSPLIPADQRDTLYPKDATPEALRATARASQASPNPHLSEFPLLLGGKLKLTVPVYTVWGACEDVAILEKFRTGEYDTENLHVVDEATSRTLEIGGIKLRLLGLGGAFVPHKLFDNGDGAATIAGGSGTMWTTALQIGELVDTAQKTFDQSETRLFVTHASPGREGLLAQLALVLKADLTVSAALHFRYASSWNEFSVQSDGDAYRSKLLAGKESFSKIWDSVKSQVESVMDEHQKLLLEKTFMVSERVPAPSATGPANEEPAWKNTWNWNLCDASFGHLVLDIREGRISAELKSQGFNYGYRRAPPPATTTGNAAATSTPVDAAKLLPSSASSSALQQIAATPQPASQQNVDKPESSNHVPSTALVTTMSTSLTRATPPPKPSSQTIVNGINGASANSISAPSPKSPIGELATRATASPAPAGDFKHKKLSNVEKKERKKERSASEASNGNFNPNGSSKPPSPGPGPNAAGGKHGQKGSKASAGVASPASVSSPAPAPATLAADGRLSAQDSNRPVTGGSSGVRSPPPPPRTPSSGGFKRHPWTLYVSRLPASVNEQEIRECFVGDTKDSITFIKLLPSSGKTQKPVAFVEFKDEETMLAALAKSTKKINDQTIAMVIADNRERGRADGPSNSGPSDNASHNNNGNGNNNNFQNQQNGGNPSRGGGGGPMSSRGIFRGRGGGRGGANLFAQAQRGLGQGGGAGRGMGARKESADGGSVNGATSPSPGPAANLD
ncbi:hypothetical protein FRB96_008992 [Tulasnella sp. 330]|nr:hypothetical protein FRB96_008992 [Tulasnella sp. 330]